jgi:hypothetical protein
MNAQRLVLHCMNVIVLGTNFWQFQEAIDKLTKAALGKSDTQMMLQISTILSIVLVDRGPLIDMLPQTLNLKSSRTHDRLYAIMHLANDFQENDIDVDYNKTASQVMLDAADHHIRLHRNLRFLDSCFWSNFDENEYAEHNSERSFLTWIPRTWSESFECGTPISSSQRRLGHEITIGEQLDDDEDSSDKILATGKYAHNKRSVKSLTNLPDNELFTTCASDSVDMTHMRLRVRAMKVGEVRTVLPLPIERDRDGMTVAQFWSSGLGQHIGSYFCREKQQIPLEVVRALARWWPNQYINYENVVLGLKWFYDWSTRPDLADRHIGFGGHLIDALVAPLPNYSNHSAAITAISHIVMELTDRKCILTDKDQFGLIPECNIRAGDEIWMLLGCSVTCVLRKQPNGTYEHICTAKIPVLMDSIVGHTDIRRFSTKAAPGEQIGEWTIEDIELV